MSCSEELKGHYKINNKTEFNKVIKAMVKGKQETIDIINELVKEYKSKTRDRSCVDWKLVKDVCPAKWSGRGEYARIITKIDLDDWDIRNQIKWAIKQRGKLKKAKKTDLHFDEMTIDFENQSFRIDVSEENHAVRCFNAQAEIRAFWKALQDVKWQQRGNKDGGYCTYNCEYQDSPNHQDYYGRIGDDMFAWYIARPF